MSPVDDDVDLESIYSQICSSVEDKSQVIFQNTQKLSSHDNLMYTTVLVQGSVELNAMVDSGSMACTLSSHALSLLERADVLTPDALSPTSVTLVGCGGLKTSPLGVCDLQMKVYGCSVLVPTLIVDGQGDDLILGSNVIKHLIRVKNTSGDYGVMSNSDRTDVGGENLLQLLSCVEKWRGGAVPERVGTVRLKHAVTLEPMQEHLVWGRLPKGTCISAGSTVIVEPSEARTVPRTVMVGRVVTPLWGDGWVPVKVINPSSKPVTLRRNCKLADVHPCVALEDFDSDYSYTTERQPANVQCNVAQADNQSVCGSEKSLTVDSDCTPRRPSSSVLHDLGLQEIDVGSCQISPYWKGRLVDLLARYESVFSRHSMDCGKAKDFVHRIHLSDTKPFRLPYRRLSPSHYEKLREALDVMEEREIIRKSTSEYASPLVLVWKKNGDLRLCTDFRWLNARTVKDAHPLPHQADALAALGGNAFFSTMDLTSGYYNVEVHEQDKRFTAFTSPFGLYEYNRLPQGLCNSPATFMRMMMAIFGDQNFMSLLCYLDDVLVFAPDEQLALQRLEMVFERLEVHNLKLSPKKCHFMKSSVKFLGHIVSKDGVSTDPEKVRAMVEITEQDLMEHGTGIPSPSKIKSFLGMVVFYQQYIEGCSRIGKPLFNLTSGMKKPRHGRGRKKPKADRQLTSADWTPECSEAFNLLKQALLEKVTLAHPDFTKPFLLSVDASSNGLGAVLSQVGEGEDVARPVAFASKSLNYAQSRYPAHRLEFLALKWAVCDKFSHWLRGQSFTVWTDNNPLTYILTKPKLDACEQRWVAKLAPYNFDIRYIPGPKNVVADALSREPFVQPSVFHRLTRVPYGALLEEARALSTDCVQDVFRWSCHPFDPDVGGRCPGAGPSTATVAANCATVIGSQGNYITPREVSAVLSRCQSQDEYVWPHAYLLPQLTQGLQPSPQSEVHALSRQELMEMQRADICLSRVLFFVERQRRPSRRERAHEAVDVLHLLRHWGRLSVQMGVLYRVSRGIISKKKSFQYVVPAVLREKVLQGVHDEAGHQGQHRTLSLTRQRFYWQGLDRDVREYVRCCRRCVFSKSPEPEARAPLESIVTSRPLELVCIDFWSAEDSSNKSVDVLVVTDHFTKLAQAYPCSNQSAKVVARQLWDNFFCTYGFPERVHSDQGANFESSLITEMLQVAGVQKSHTTPYHPMGNGCVERFNRTLGNMIRALPPKAKHRWPQMLKALTFSYNATVHETTGYAPFHLMFGRCPRLPVDMMFESVLQDEQVIVHDAYVQALRRDLAEAVKIAQASTSKQQKRQANLYDRKLKGAPVAVGDRVLLANKGERGKRKLADRWEGHLYVVTEKNEKVHTFKIRNSETGVQKVVHRNLIMPVNFLPVQDGSEADPCETDIASDVDDSCEGDVEVDSVAATVGDSDDRTVAWVSELPAPGEDQSDASEDVHSMGGTMTDRETDRDTSSSVAADTVCPTGPTQRTPPLIDTQRSSSASTLVCAGPSQGPIVPLASARALHVSSRCRRTVRPVRRLIESMPMNVFVGK